ncbi:MAG: tetratricopeptide repeat protein [Candidatus Firestonebacteria bacterium]
MLSFFGFKISNKTAVLAAVLTAFVIAGFLPAFNGGFTNWDDESYVLKNPSIQSFTLDKTPSFFLTFSNSNYHPLTMLSYAIEHSIFGNSQGVYHTTNILLHLLNCFLVFRLIYLLSGKLYVAFAVALLFGIHPLRVESVAWISERKDVLYAFFYLFALLQYFHYRVSGGKKYFLLFAFSFLFSLLSKGSAVTLPFAALLLDFFLEGKFEKKRLISMLPFAAISILFTITGILAQATSGAITQENTGFLKNLAYGVSGIGFYLEKLLVPNNLSNLYTRNISVSNLIFLVLFSAAAFFAVIRKSKIMLFGILFFLVTIIPSLQFVPLGEGVHADRYSYIPSIGLFFIAIVLADKFYEYSGKRAAVKYLLIFSLAAAACTFTLLTYQRARMWENSLTLWSSTLKINPLNITALNNRGAAYNSLAQYDKALADYDAVLKLDPNNGLAHYNYGLTYINLNRLGEAREFLNTSMKLNPRMKEQSMALLSICDDLGRKASALKLPELPPTDKIAARLFNSGNQKLKLGLYGDAIVDFTAAIALDSKKAEYYNNRGIVYTNTGQFEKARIDFGKALLLKQDYTNARKNLEKLESFIKAAQYKK